MVIKVIFENTELSQNVEKPIKDDPLLNTERVKSGPSNSLC
jgi:hypothetical protein